MCEIFRARLNGNRVAQIELHGNVLEEGDFFTGRFEQSQAQMRQNDFRMATPAVDSGDTITAPCSAAYATAGAGARAKL